MRAHTHTYKKMIFSLFFIGINIHILLLYMYIAFSIQPFRRFLFVTLENILKRESLKTKFHNNFV